MQTVKLNGIEGEFHVIAENGVFVTLLAMSHQNIDGNLLYLPNAQLGFKEWQAMGGSLDGSAPIKYVYGKIECHKNQIERNSDV